MQFIKDTTAHLKFERLFVLGHILNQGMLQHLKNQSYLVHKKQTPHFDVNHIPYVTWDEGALNELEVALRSAIEARGL